MFELIYTSAPRGLLQGRSGYTTVALTAGMPPNLILPVENLSGYNFTLRDGQFSPEFNPVSCSYRKVRFGNMVLHVASRIAPCGLDYSGRNNKLAHHLIFETPAEAAALSGGAAEAFLADGNFRTGWSEGPHTLPARRVHAGATPFAPPCRTWETLTGDAGYAAMIARRLTTSDARPFYLACPRTMETATLLMLAAEIASLLPPEERADLTFTTCFDREQPGEECFLRMIPDFSPALGNLRKFHAADLLDLTMSVPPLPEECADPELLSIARFGRKETIELAPEPPAEPLRPADPEESEADRPWRRPLPSPIWNRPLRPHPPQSDAPQTPQSAPRRAPGPRIVPGQNSQTNPFWETLFSRRYDLALVLVGVVLVILIWKGCSADTGKPGDGAAREAAAAPAQPEPPAAKKQPPAPETKETAPPSGSKGPDAQRQPDPAPAAVSAAPEQKTERSAPDPAPAAVSAAPEQKTERSTPDPAPAAVTAAPEQKTERSTPDPVPAAVTAAPEQKTEPARRNIPREKRRSANQPTQVARKLQITSRDSVQIVLEGQSRPGLFDVEITTVNGKTVANPDRFVLCPSGQEVWILSGKRNGNAIEPDPTKEAALRISYGQVQGARTLKIDLPEQGELQPRLADIRTFYFSDHPDKVLAWKWDFQRLFLHRYQELLKKQSVRFREDGQLQFYFPASPKSPQRFWNRMADSIFPNKLPIRDWNRRVEQWETSPEEAREKLKKLYDGIDEQLAAISPELAGSFRQEVGDPRLDCPRKLMPGKTTFSFGAQDKQPQNSH